MKQHTDLAGIVLAGVHTWGESPLDELCPRPLLPVAGRPLFTYALSWLAAQSIRRVVVCANSNTTAFRRVLRNSGAFDLDLDYYEDEMPRGPAGCIFDAAAAVEGDTFVVLDSAVVTDIDLEPVLRAHREKKAAVTIVAKTPQHRDRGKTDAGTLEPTGIYIVSRSALRHVPPTAYQDIKEMWLPRLYALGEPVMAFIVEPDRCLHVSGLASYFGLHEWVLSDDRRACPTGPEYRRIGDAHVHKSTRLASGARFTGACVVGPGCEIESGVAVFGPGVIGAHNVLESGTVVNRSLIWSHCRVKEGAILDRCIIGNENIIGRGAALRNRIMPSYRSDKMSSAPDETYWRLPFRSPFAERPEFLPVPKLPGFDTLLPGVPPAMPQRLAIR